LHGGDREADRVVSVILGRLGLVLGLAHVNFGFLARRFAVKIGNV
jgi:hypothetical protein